MKTRGIIVEDFCNYKLPSLFISSISCDWKCCIEQGVDKSICQNASIALSKIVDVRDDKIYSLYKNNVITKAVVIGGLEPFLQFDEVDRLISLFRDHEELCDFVLYTGYYPDEITDKIEVLSRHKNIIIKFGRYIQNMNPKYDDVLGITLISDNQFAKRIS